MLLQKGSKPDVQFKPYIAPEKQEEKKQPLPPFFANNGKLKQGSE